MKRIIVSLFVLASFIGVQAQDSHSAKSSVLFGARAGVNIFDMRYTSDDYDIYRNHYRVREQLGLFAEFDYIWEGLSIGLDMLYTPGGARLTWQDIDYRLTSYYFDFRIPISYTFFHDEEVQPYLMVAPSLNFALGGVAAYYSEYTNAVLPLSRANFRPVDFSLFFGLGMKAPISIGKQTLYVGGEFGYNLGLCNTFSKMEENNIATAVNLPMYDVTGKRKNGGFEIAARLSWMIPHKEKAPEVVEVVVVKEEPVVPVAPVKEEPKNENLIEYKPKECYSIEEMKAFITLNMPIEDKRICMFDMKFEFASAVLKKESEKQLDKFVELYFNFPNMMLQINGHTDNIGTTDYNQKLSEDRALSVYNYFLKKGIPANKMAIKGFGCKYPIETNDTDEGRAMNRRVEVDIQMIGD